jgi:hypothetical protein
MPKPDRWPCRLHMAGCGHGVTAAKAEITQILTGLRRGHRRGQPEVLRASDRSPHGRFARRGSSDRPRFHGTEAGMGLHGVNGLPVHDQRVRISANVQPSRKGTVNHCEEQPTKSRIQTRYQLVRYRPHLAAADRREGKAHRSSIVRDDYPALDQLSSELAADIIGVDGLLE